MNNTKKEELTRKTFMKETGVFVSNIYFETMFKSDYEHSNLSPKDFPNNG
ncbi:hypothetical protein [Caproiciproducens sp.]